MCCKRAIISREIYRIELDPLCSLFVLTRAWNIVRPLHVCVGNFSGTPKVREFNPYNTRDFSFFPYSFSEAGKSSLSFDIVRFSRAKVSLLGRYFSARRTCFIATSRLRKTFTAGFSVFRQFFLSPALYCEYVSTPPIFGSGFLDTKPRVLCSLSFFPCTHSKRGFATMNLPVASVPLFNREMKKKIVVFRTKAYTQQLKWA